MKLARVSWSKSSKSWKLRIWNEKDEKWDFKEEFKISDEDEKGFGKVSDEILVEISDLQYGGYNVEVVY